MNGELSRISAADQLPLYNYTEVYLPVEDAEAAGPLTVAHLQESLDRWRGCEQLLGEPIPRAEDILVNEKAVATLTHLHTTHKALVAAGVRVDQAAGLNKEAEEPTYLTRELQLVALPWRALRKYAGTPRQLVRDIHEIHQEYYDQATDENGAKTRVIDNSDECLKLDLDNLMYHQPGTSPDNQESVASYIDRKIEKEGPWGFMLIQKGDEYWNMAQFPITGVRSSYHGIESERRLWAGDTQIPGDNLGVIEWAALLAQRSPAEVTDPKISHNNLDAALFANPLITQEENPFFGEAPDQPMFDPSFRLPMLRHVTSSKSENVRVIGDYIGWTDRTAHAGRIAIAANTDPDLLDEIINEGAKLHPKMRMPYTWAKRELERTTHWSSIVSRMQDGGGLEGEVPRLIDLVDLSSVAESLRRLHLTQLFYQQADLSRLGIPKRRPLTFHGGDPMGQHTNLELMPWQALFEADQNGNPVAGKILETSALPAANVLASLNAEQKDVDSQLSPRGTLRDQLVQRLVSDGPWGIALYGVRPEKKGGHLETGIDMFSL